MCLYIEIFKCCKYNIKQNEFQTGVIVIVAFGSFFATLATMLFWAAALMVFIRICVKAAGFDDVRLVKMPSPWPAVGRFFSYLSSEEKGPHIIIKIIIFGVLVRVAMLLLAVMFLHMDGREVSFSAVFHSFNRWDAGHYLTLARAGYSHLEFSHSPRIGEYRHLFVVFFPLYPYLIRFVGFFIRNYLAAAYVVSFASYLAGLCYLYHLVKLDFSEKTAWWAVLLISIFPHSFFFGAPHTESLFLLTTAMTLYYIRKHNWLWAGVAGAFATATRMVGVILVAAAAVEFVMHYEMFTLMKKGKWSEFFTLIYKKGLYILLMLVGILVYLFINWRITGEPLRFLFYQEAHWNNGFLFFRSAIADQFHRISPYLGAMYQNSHLYIAAPNILGFGFSIWMIAYASLKRYNAGYIVYALGYTLVSFSMIWLLSGGRYAAALVPSFIFVADYVEKKPHRRIIVPVAFIALLLPVLRMYVLGGWVM